MLPCGHTFCLACLEDVVDTSAATLRCPRCHMVDSTSPAALPRNYIVELKEIEPMTMHLNGELHKCENNRCGSAATVFCKNCNAALCQRCDSNIHMNSILKKHTHVDIALRPVQCPDHKEPTSFFCEQDKILVCQDCLKPGAKHDEHPTTHVDKVAAMEREQMERHAAVLDREDQRLAADEAAIDQERQALAADDKAWCEEVGGLEQRMRRDLQQVFVQLREEAGREVAERGTRLERDQGLLRAVREEIGQSLGLAERARQASSAGLVQQGAGRRLDEVTRRAQAASWRAGKRGRVDLDLDGVQQVAAALANLVARGPVIARPAKVG